MSFVKSISGLVSFVTLCITSFFYYEKYNELDCGNLKLGIAFGICSLLVFFVNIISYICSCNNKCVMYLSGLFLIGSTSYNIYINHNIDNSCIEKYKEKNIWEYYLYMYIIMIILSILYCIYILIDCCYNKE